MATVQVRKQGGAAIMTIPSDVAKQLGIAIGTELEVVVIDGAMSARPRLPRTRRRYSLNELLEGVTPALMRSLKKDTEWAREGDPVGREI